MSTAGPGDGDVTPAHQRLSEHFELLRSDPPTAAPELIALILRRARWQVAVRDPLVFMGAISGAVAEGVALLLRPPVVDR